MNGLKLYIKIVVLFAAVTLFQGCKDWLQLEPPNSLTQSEYWQTKEDVSSVVMSAYQKLANQDATIWAWGEIRGDMISETEKSSNEIEDIMRGTLSSTQKMFKWNGFYSAINSANYVLTFAPDVLDRDPTFEQYLLDSYLSEALYVRSLAYFYLVRAFRDVPLVLRSSESDDQNFFVEKSSEEDILNQIISDLKFAEEHVISNYGNIENNKSRATKSGVQALLADIYLWKEEYDSCIIYTDKVLEENRLSMMPSLIWFDMFYSGASIESVFEFYYSESQPNHLYSMHAPVGSGNYTYSPSEYALEILDYTKETVRGHGSYNPFSESYPIWKFIGRASTNASVSLRSDSKSSNLIIYRLAEIYLMKAEALVEKERFDEALTIINKVRLRARMPLIDNVEGKSAMRSIVLEERAVELAFEGKRWWDLLRMGRRNNFESEDLFVNLITNRLPVIDKIVVQNRLKDHDSWFFPIYIDELEANPNLEQNPYYFSEIQ